MNSAMFFFYFAHRRGVQQCRADRTRMDVKRRAWSLKKDQ